MEQMLRLVGCIILDNAGDILMLHRNTPKCTQWEIPGGNINDGEELAIAAARGAQEELGVSVSIIRPLGDWECTESGHTVHYTWFLAQITAGEPYLAEPGYYDKFGYFSPVMLGRRYDELSSNTQNFMQQLAYGRIELPVSP